MRGVSFRVNAVEYQRMRLWSGIVSIGVNMGVIVGLAVTAGWWGSFFTSIPAQIALLAVIPIGLALANLPFEILTGHACESASNRTVQPLAAWLADWRSGVIPTVGAQVFGYLFFYSLALLPADARWLVAILLAASVISVALWKLGRGGPWSFAEGEAQAGFSEAMNRELARLSLPCREVVWVRDADTSAVNGTIPPFGNRILLSTNVEHHLTPREAALMVAREDWFARSGTSRRAAAIAGGWLLAGVTLALLLPGSNPIQSALTGVAVVTVWCFIALFVWPTLNRKWMEDADRALASLAPHDEVITLLAKIQNLNLTDTQLRAAKTWVFHPIPPLEQRIRNLT